MKVGDIVQTTRYIGLVVSVETVCQIGLEWGSTEEKEWVGILWHDGSEDAVYADEARIMKVEVKDESG